jgi:hypothetical protein
MNFFNKILTKLGLRKDEPTPPPAPTTPPPAPTTGAADKGEKDNVVPAPAPAAVKPVAPSAAVSKPVAPAAPITPPAAPAAPAKPAVVAISEVDVVKHLETLADGTNLDWKVSIVDLLKLLEIDSSREARKELATELGCPADLMEDSAKMNVWLHKTVLKKIAENGGNIPQALLD